jgi:tripartite-type tricarboxylate transporter receptor subunit TctC
MPTVRYRLIAIWTIAVLSLGNGLSAAKSDDWPSRPVKIVVPYGPGGSTDVMARIIADRLAEKLGQPFVIQDRPGAGGAIGTEDVIRSPKDGQTLYASSGAQFAVLPLIQKLSYNPLKDLTPISLVGVSGMFFAISSNVPVGSVDEFIAYAKAHPGELNYAFSGVGGTSHLAVSAFRSRADIEMVAVPYPTVSQAIVDLLSGQVQLYIGNIADLVEYSADKRIKLLAVTTERRNAQLPDLPAMTETLPDFVFTVWQGIFAPTGTSPAIIDRLAREIVAICRTADISKKLTDIKIDPICGMSDDLAETVRHDLPVYAAAVTAAGLRLPQ